MADLKKGLKDKMPGNLHVGIIGCGVIAPEHISAYQNIPGVTVSALCDTVREKAQTLAERFRVGKVCTDMKELLNWRELDAVSICTDHESHADAAVAALEAGKHVLCEKPLSSSRKNMDRMIQAGERHPELVFAGVFQHRFDHSVLYAKELLDSGCFGKMLCASLVMPCLRTDAYYFQDAWRGTWKQEGGSLLMNQAIHFIDLLQWLMGGVEDLRGFHANRNHEKSIETEDCASAALRFRNGALGSILATSASHLAWEPLLSFYGTECTLELRNNRLLRFVSRDKELEKKVTEHFGSMENDVDSQKEKYYYGLGHPAQIRDFIAAIREKRAPRVTAQEARVAVDLVQRLYARD